MAIAYERLYETSGKTIAAVRLLSGAADAEAHRPVEYVVVEFTDGSVLGIGERRGGRRRN